METITPPSTGVLVTVTLLSRGEKEMAFSISSASRWTASVTAGPTMRVPDGIWICTRS